jgi:L-ascorbate metabolism protein UlaG (beta-lactamase superfamily)
MGDERINDPGTLEFVGTATTLLRLGGFTVLTDPNFLHRGQRAYLGYGLTTKRITEPAMRPDQLPPLDAVVLSHMHGDHFDRIAKRSLRKDVPVVTTPEAAGKLLVWGFESSTGLPRWDTFTMKEGTESLRITSVPGVHGPGAVDRLLPEVMGSVLELRQGEDTFRIYITGDTLFRPQLREVRDRFPDLDAMIVHLGGTKIMGILLTMDGRQGADLVELIAPPVTVPIHYDDYTVFRSPLRDFLAEVERRDLPGEIRPVRRGQKISLRR